MTGAQLWQPWPRVQSSKAYCIQTDRTKMALWSQSARLLVVYRILKSDTGG